MEDETRGLQVSQVDLRKRYDVYQGVRGEERLYENVKLIGLKSLEETGRVCAATSSRSRRFSVRGC